MTGSKGKSGLAVANGMGSFNRHLGWLLLLACCWLPTILVKADSAALIVTGMGPSADGTAQFLSLAKQTKDLLVQRGFPEKRVEILHENVTRELILQKLQSVTVSTNDEFWLVLYGVMGHTHGNLPAFQIHGPRLTAEDLKPRLDRIPARQFVFIGTDNGGGFLPVLQGPRRTVLSATEAEGEPGFPRYPEIWLNVFGKNPKAPFAEIAARASANVATNYDSLHLAVSEHAQMTDPKTGKILDAPFGVNLNATNAPDVSSVPAK